MFYRKILYLIGFTLFFAGNVHGQDGGALYLEHCARCHQPNGEGWGFDVPQLMGSRILNGPDEALIEFVLLGTENRDNFTTDFIIGMPTFQNLEDKEIAAILTYIRKSFGEDGTAISKEAVGTVKGMKISQKP